jgi:hypothetical protein
MVSVEIYYFFSFHFGNPTPPHLSMFQMSPTKNVSEAVFCVRKSLKNKKAHPFLRTGFDLNQSFNSPTEFCLTISKKQHDGNGSSGHIKTHGKI